MYWNVVYSIYASITTANVKDYISKDSGEGCMNRDVMHRFYPRSEDHIVKRHGIMTGSRLPWR